MITRRGLMADFVSNCRSSSTDVYAFTNMSQPRRTMMLNRGVFPSRSTSAPIRRRRCRQPFILKDREQFLVGDKVVIISDVLAQQRVDSSRSVKFPPRNRRSKSSIGELGRQRISTARPLPAERSTALTGSVDGEEGRLGGADAADHSGESLRVTITSSRW
ncbi:MAG: hypothetical protein U0361_04650 [Nitrospiraceae bacterium]